MQSCATYNYIKLSATTKWSATAHNKRVFLNATAAGKRRLGRVDAAAARAAAAANQQWLEDCIVLLLCVLALDRFGDYVSNQVTAPVRESAAQVLGMAVRPLKVSSSLGASSAPVLAFRWLFNA